MDTRISVVPVLRTPTQDMPLFLITVPLWTLFLGHTLPDVIFYGARITEMEDYHKLRFLAQPLSVLCFLPTLFHQKYDFARLIRFLFTFRCWVGSLQFRTTLSNIPFPIYQGILPCCFPVSSHVPWFSPIFPRHNFPFFLFRDLFNDTAEFTLCYGLRDCLHLFKVTLSTRLAPCITITHRF